MMSCITPMINDRATAIWTPEYGTVPSSEGCAVEYVLMALPTIIETTAKVPKKDFIV